MAGMYTSHGYARYELTKEEYDYLLPIYGRCASDNGFTMDAFVVSNDSAGRYYFVGSELDWRECCARLKGL